MAVILLDKLQRSKVDLKAGVGQRGLHWVVAAGTPVMKLDPQSHYAGQCELQAISRLFLALQVHPGPIETPL